MLETIQIVKLRIRQPTDPAAPIGKLSRWKLAVLQRQALDQTKANAVAQGAEVLEYTVDSAEVVEV
jgi:hypothetical protein